MSEINTNLVLNLGVWWQLQSSKSVVLLATTVLVIFISFSDLLQLFSIQTAHLLLGINFLADFFDVPLMFPNYCRSSWCHLCLMLVPAIWDGALQIKHSGQTFQGLFRQPRGQFCEMKDLCRHIYLKTEVWFYPGGFGTAASCFVELGCGDFYRVCRHFCTCFLQQDCRLSTQNLWSG